MQNENGDHDDSGKNKSSKEEPKGGEARKRGKGQDKKGKFS